LHETKIDSFQKEREPMGLLSFRKKAG